jgi:hypothetical protein
MWFCVCPGGMCFNAHMWNIENKRLWSNAAWWNYACYVMYYNVTHAWRHVFLHMYIWQGLQTIKYPCPWLHAWTKNFGFCVLMFLRTIGCVMVRCALATLLKQGAVEISLLSKKDHFSAVLPVQMQKEDLSSASVPGSGCIVKCVCMWVLGSWSARDASANARHAKRSTGCIILKGWTAWKRLYWVKCCTVQSVKFVSLPLLGKLGTRQYFQKVSSREIVQSTEEWHKHVAVHMKKRICKYMSVCPACRHFVCLTCY